MKISKAKAALNPTRNAEAAAQGEKREIGAKAEDRKGKTKQSRRFAAVFCEIGSEKLI